MCLEKRTFLPRISSKPITVYKCLIKDEEFRTPFMRTKVVFNNGQCVLKAKGHWLESIFKSSIADEGVHAFTSKWDAFKMVEDARPLLDFSVFEAVIPPFTPYYKGRFDSEICASKMIIYSKKVHDK